MIRPATGTRLLATAETIGQDSRRRIVTLTASGLDLHDRVIEVALEREKLLLQDLSEDEIALVVKLLRRMHNRVEIVNAYVPNVPDAKRPAKKKAVFKQAAE